MNYRLSSDVTGGEYGKKTMGMLIFYCLKVRLTAFVTTSACRTAVAVLIAGFVASAATAQNRVDLEDLSVKGELLNDNRMRMTSRDATRMQDRVHYRKNFRPEIIEEQELRMPAEEPANEASEAPSP